MVRFLTYRTFQVRWIPLTMDGSDGDYGSLLIRTSYFEVQRAPSSANALLNVRLYAARGPKDLDTKPLAAAVKIRGGQWVVGGEVIKDTIE